VVFTRNMAVDSFTELLITTNYSFLQGASHPYELAQEAKRLGYQTIGIADQNTLGGVVRAQQAANQSEISLCIGSTLLVSLDESAYLTKEPSAPLDKPYMRLVVYPLNRAAYGNLSRLLSDSLDKFQYGESQDAESQDNLNNTKIYRISDLLEYLSDWHTIAAPAYHPHRSSLSLNHYMWLFCRACERLKDSLLERDLLSIALLKTKTHRSAELVSISAQIAEHLKCPLLASSDVLYHVKTRQPLQDVLTCIKHNTTLDNAGYLLEENAERYLRSVASMQKSTLIVLRL
jgi:error-prone DNA polymerase